MKRSLERHLPFPVLLWRATTQPFWNMLAWAVDLLIRIKYFPEINLHFFIREALSANLREFPLIIREYSRRLADIKRGSATALF